MLAARAAIVFVDEPFVEPHLSVVHRLSRQKKLPPVVSVDASCVVPARLVPRDKCNRAYAYRSATAVQRSERALAMWPALETTPPLPAVELDTLKLPMSLFTDLTSEDVSIPALVESLEHLDHSVLRALILMAVSRMQSVGGSSTCLG